MSLSEQLAVRSSESSGRVGIASISRFFAIRQRLSIVLAALGALGSFVVGCGAPMTQTEIDQFGTKTFQAPAEKVFVAVVAALKAQSFPIAVENAEKGMIKTGRRLIRTVAQSTGNGSAQAVDIFRQYTVTVRAAGDNQTSVAARPSIYQGDVDISEGKIWALEGAQGERTLRQNLFRDIAEQL